MITANKTPSAANVNARHAKADNNPKTAWYKSLRMVVDRSEKKTNNLISRLTFAFRKNPLGEKYNETKNNRPEGLSYSQIMNGKHETTLLSKSELEVAGQRVEKWVESTVDMHWTNDSLPEKPVHTAKQRLNKAINTLSRGKDKIISPSEADENERTAASPKDQRSNRNILNIFSQRKASFSSSEGAPSIRPQLKRFWKEP